MRRYERGLNGQMKGLGAEVKGQYRCPFGGSGNQIEGNETDDAQECVQGT